MCLLFETIRIEQSRLCNLEWHFQRIKKSFENLFWDNLPADKTIDRPEFPVTPALIMEKLNALSLPEGLHKCKAIYNTEVFELQILPYTRNFPEKFRLIDCQTIDYSFKFFNRDEIDKLYSQKEDADDIIIVKNGCITDTSNANLVFFDGLKYYTTDTPLLQGTHRARLLAEGKVVQCRITVDDLKNFKSFQPVNAMSEEGLNKLLPVENIFL